MRRLTQLLLAALGVGASVLLGTSPAVATTCKTVPLAEATSAADVVFVGTVTQREVEPRRRPDGELRTRREVTYTVDVLRTFKGSVPDPVTVTSVITGKPCGALLMAEDPVQRFAFVLPQDLRFTSQLDAPVKAAPTTVMTQLEDLFPDQAPPPPPEPEPVTRTPADQSAPLQ
ncbi:MAG: hypothetical protein WAW88_10525, partial [Nocardioides sp.]